MGAIATTPATSANASSVAADASASAAPRLLILAIAKNEAHIVPEWLAHYRRQGVVHFHVIDNGSSDGTAQALRAHDDVTVTELFEQHRQEQHYNAVYKGMLKSGQVQGSDWLLVVDMDEFAFASMPGETLARVLRYVAESDSTIGAVAIPWIMFGSNGHERQPPSVTAGFTRRRWYGDGVSTSFKCATRCGAIKKVGIHRCKLRRGFRTVGPSTLWAEEPAMLSEATIPSLAVRINHYAIQSWEYFERVKMTRGDAATVKNVRDAAYFSSYDHNDVEDYTLAAGGGEGTS